MTHAPRDEDQLWDVIIVGGGVSGCFWAYRLSQAGLRCLLVEAGRDWVAEGGYPRNEAQSSTQLYWSGGIELNTHASLGLVRPKVLGGGSVVNQALMDRMPEDALEEWRKASGLNWSSEVLRPWYEAAERELVIQQIPEDRWNANARLFVHGASAQGLGWAPLKRAQKDCRYDDGTDCIDCLGGCSIDSKQSMNVTVLPKAIAAGCRVVTDCEIVRIDVRQSPIQVLALHGQHGPQTLRARKVVLAAGAIGNSRLMLVSGLGTTHGAVGCGFYSHPQDMVLGLFDEPVDAHRGAFQTVKSQDPRCWQDGYKLESVFMPPAALAMLVPGGGASHREIMSKYRYLGLIESAIRDSNPGRITVTRKGRLRVSKTWNPLDRRRRRAGLAMIERIFASAGAKATVPGEIAIGLHLMGGCAIGKDFRTAVVDPQFRVLGIPDVHIADSSIFPRAPGINPSLTIMALTLWAAELLVQELRP